jgi:hypothetical protein
MQSGSRLYDWIAAAIAAVLSLVELVRIFVFRGGTPGHTTFSTFLGGIIFAVVLALAAVGLAAHRRLGWLLGVFGFLVAVAHGVITRVGGNPAGFLYLAGAAALFALLVKDLRFYHPA